ncbi:MAG: hypothetical protein MK135_16490, partial [Polyangiaceae bacterium]|nr:hypothetical protein [Polyangiaceae bacterium]
HYAAAMSADQRGSGGGEITAGRQSFNEFASIGEQRITQASRSLEQEPPHDQYNQRTREELRRPPVRIPRVSHFIFTHALGKVWLLGIPSGLYAAALGMNPDLVPFTIPLEALLTFAVGLMLSIRVSKAYDRWWEARKQWGKLVNISRNLAIKILHSAAPDEQERIEAQRLIQGFPRSLKNHLRGDNTLQDVRGFVLEKAEPKHVPAFIASQIFSLLESFRRDGRLSETRLLIIDSEARELLEVAGACERIHNTPMSPSFPAFIRFAIALVLLSLPVELWQEIGAYTIIAQVVATFLLCGGESIAHALERPFGVFTDDLDLESYCNGIDRVTAEILGVRSRAD